MDKKVSSRLNTWQKKLLDMGMRNQLLNFKELKRSSLYITTPDNRTLFQQIVLEERMLTFASVDQSQYMVSEEEPSLFDEDFEKEPSARYHEIPGDLVANKNGMELQGVLKTLRSRAKTADEEQGVNILYLSFGFLEWSEAEHSKIKVKSPLILVPVVLNIESITSPYVLSLHEDEIVVNPTLAYKLENDYKIILPSFDPQSGELEAFFAEVENVTRKMGWTISRNVALSLLSFLKINMYRDLELHGDAIADNPVVKALCGVDDAENETAIICSMDSYDHDTQRSPSEVFQVMDADSSQMDAIELSKRGVSFVLQGPPGTGKSQTITNIIAEALMAGKKVLFVSEKMAALDVVYKRLSASGLADFCLVLHSHKANKKDLLNSLGSTLRLRDTPKQVSEEAMLDLRKLEKQRLKLNEYCQQLHQKIPPLNQSVFEANGVIASLESAPYIAFDLSRIPMEALTASDLMDLRLAVQEYAKTLGKLTESYEENTWRNSTLQSVTYALSHDIKSRFDRLTEKITALDSGSESYQSELHLDCALTIDDLPEFSEMLETAGHAEDFPEHWLHVDDLSSYEEAAQNRKKAEETQDALKAAILAEFTDAVFSLPANELLSRATESFSALSVLLNDTCCDQTYLMQNAKHLDDLSSRAAICYRRQMEVTGHISEELDIPALTDPKGVREFCAFLRLYGTDFRADKSWFNSEKWTSEAFQEKLALAKSLIDNVGNLKTKLLSIYREDVLPFEYSPVLNRFLSDYASPLRFLNGHYRADTKALKALQRDPSAKYSYETLTEHLKLIQQYHEAEEKLNQNFDAISHTLGGHYKGVDTDFQQVSAAAENFRKVSAYLGGRFCADSRLEILEGRNTAKYEAEADELETMTGVGAFVDCLRREPQTMSDGIVRAEKIRQELSTLNEAFAPLIATAVHDGDPARYPLYLTKLAEYRQQELDNPRQIEDCKTRFAFLFEEQNTDWTVLFNRLALVKAFRQHSAKFRLSSEYSKGIAASQQYRELSAFFADYLRQGSENIREDVDWLVSLFEPDEQITAKSLSDLKVFITRCRNNLKGLEAWVDFCHAKQKCEQAGLTDFVEVSLQKQLNPEEIESIFMKRFEHFWLDFVMPQLPAVGSFRSRNQNELVAEFRNLDVRQFQIAQARIRASLIKALPDTGGFAAAKDELSILRHEMEKQRKIMPVRKLFASIPNLLPRLKPCLMMSPLSVSLFLQDDSYQFDTVIFDEASQVQTENAIGAISRGRQVIIAGDIHQLPPTNFFTVSVSGEDEYDDDSEEDTDAYESVLSEARAVLPEEELKWHYRSRNEDLITFSNRKIYKDSLVTFPSPSENGSEEGVEYIYVPDGIYDRGNKRVNLIEAQKTVDVIFSEIQTHPQRSLGVITFSEAQMHCVENELMKRRLKNPMYEDFFNENKEEAFFIKNLENVQGDERDTILLCIGYAKSSSVDSLKMNFGPLNKSGGYRRLNVAVTRAKYAVKLIGSILPTDMAINENSPQGVRLLRDYIDFAMNGASVLKNELEYSDEINTDSPFEDAVYDYLSTRGYSLATQVGCSGYRIDMAVRHPVLHGKFVVGIECDGASYHSSRTARERDRLRQTVLEGMGWRFIRIWSTDWIKDPISEGQRVIAEIEKAIAEYGVTTAPTVQAPEKATAEEYIVDAEKIPQSHPFDARFRTYSELDEPRRSYEATLPETARTIDKIVKSQSPVHVDLVCKQIAPLYGNERVSSKVRTAVENTIRLFASQYKWRMKGEFLWDSSQKQIVPARPSGQYTRTVDHISTEEIAEAMYIMADISFGPDQNALYDATARAFGFQRTTEKMRSRFDDALTLLLETARLKENNGKYSVADNTL